MDAIFTESEIPRHVEKGTKLSKIQYSATHASTTWHSSDSNHVFRCDERSPQFIAKM